MEMTTNAVSWFEIPASNFERAKAFYSAIFDYDMPVMPMGPVTMGFLPHEQDKGVGGAIVFGANAVPSTHGTLVYLAGGRDLSAVLSRVSAAGGAVGTEKTAIAPGMGFYAVFTDTEGNAVGLHSME
jgi:uncharacterized protein